MSRAHGPGDPSRPVTLVVATLALASVAALTAWHDGAVSGLVVGVLGVVVGSAAVVAWRDGDPVRPGWAPASASAVLLSLLLVGPPVAGWIWSAEGIDFPTHLRVTAAFDRPWDPPVPHFLWHGLARLADLALPTADLRVAALVVTLGAVVAMVVLTFRVLVPPSGVVEPWLGAVTTVLLLGANPPSFQVNAYTSPTQILLQPLALALSCVCVAVVADLQAGRPVPAGRRTALAALAAASTLAKPSFTVVLLPALAVLGALHLRAAVGRATTTFAWWLVVPAGVVLAVQYGIYHYGLLPGLGDPGQVTIDPLAGWAAVPLADRVAGTAAVVGLGLLVVAARHTGIVADRLVQLTGLCTVVGVAQALLLAETGDTRADNNLSWGLQVAYLLVLVAAVRFLLERWRSTGRFDRVTALWAVVLVLLFLIGTAWRTAAWLVDPDLVAAGP